MHRRVSGTAYGTSSTVIRPCFDSRVKRQWVCSSQSLYFLVPDSTSIGDSSASPPTSCGPSATAIEGLGVQALIRSETALGRLGEGVTPFTESKDAEKLVLDPDGKTSEVSLICEHKFTHLGSWVGYTSWHCSPRRCHNVSIVVPVTWWNYKINQPSLDAAFFALAFLNMPSMQQCTH